MKRRIALLAALALVLTLCPALSAAWPGSQRQKL